MSKKVKNRQKQTVKKQQKKKIRQLTNSKKNNISKQLLSVVSVADRVDDALELVQQGDIATGKKLLAS